MDSEILDQLTNLEKNVDSEVAKSKRGRKKKTDTEMNEVEKNDVRDKRDRLITCILSGNSKQYLGQEYTEQQINEMDSHNINALSNRYESVLSAQITKSLGKSVINLYSNVACSVLGVGNQQDLSNAIHFLTLLCKDLHVICAITLALFSSCFSWYNNQFSIRQKILALN